MSPTFAALRVRDYRWYFSGQLVSAAGTWMQRVAQDWLVLDLTGSSGTALGITTALQFLPFLVVSPWAGVLADRFSRRALLVACQAAMGGLSVALGAAVVTGHAAVGLVYAFALLLGVVSALDNPSRQAFVGDVVDTDRLANAVALNAAAFNAARIVGPAAAGLLIAAVGSGPVFFVNAATYAVAVATLAVLSPARRSVGAGPRPTLRAGVAHVRGRRDLLAVLLLVGAVATLGLNFQLTTALMARETFGVGAGAFGLLGTVMSVGSLAGSLLAARRGSPGLRVVVVAAVAFGLLTTLAGLMPTYVAFALALPLCGLTAMTFVTSAQSYLQLGSSPRMRGRVMGLYSLVFFGGTPVGAPLIGWASDAFGPRWGLVVGGLGSAAAGAACLAALARARRRRDAGAVVLPDAVLPDAVPGAARVPGGGAPPGGVAPDAVGGGPRPGHAAAVPGAGGVDHHAADGRVAHRGAR